MASAPFFKIMPRSDNVGAAEVLKINHRSRFVVRDEIHILDHTPKQPHTPKQRHTFLSFGEKSECDMELPPALLEYRFSIKFHSRSGELIMVAEGEEKPILTCCEKPSSHSIWRFNEPKYNFQEHSNQQVILQGYKYILELGPAEFIVGDWGVRPNYIKFCREHDQGTLPLQKFDGTTLIYEKIFKHPHIDGIGTAIVALHSGDHLALKEPRDVKRFTDVDHLQTCEDMLKNEIVVLKKLNHVILNHIHLTDLRLTFSQDHIIKYIHSECSGDQKCTLLFTELYQGNLQSLLKGDGTSKYLRTLQKHTLLALQYLHNSIHAIHGDIRPTNILWKRFKNEDTHKDEWNFVLANFSFTTPVDIRMSYPRMIYAAPEEINHGSRTYKIDIFHLGRVFLEVVHKGKLPQSMPKDEKGDPSYEAWLNLLNTWARKTKPQLTPMLEKDPEKRFTATACLSYFFPKKKKGECVVS